MKRYPTIRYIRRLLGRFLSIPGNGFTPPAPRSDSRPFYLRYIEYT